MSLGEHPSVEQPHQMGCGVTGFGLVWHATTLATLLVLFQIYCIPLKGRVKGGRDKVPHHPVDTTAGAGPQGNQELQLGLHLGRCRLLSKAHSKDLDQK